MLDDFRGAFADPELDFRPVVMWVWNGRLDAARLCAQLDDIQAAGFGGTVFLPMGESFRLKDFLVGMDPPYLSDAYFDAVRAAVEHCAEIGLRFWLYDEGGWPSGSAQGHVVADHPELRAHVLTCRVEATGEPRLSADAPAPVARRAVAEDGRVTALGPGESPPAGAVVLIFEDRCLDGIYPDLMNPAAVARFIAVTHERYAEVVGDHFGGAIPGIFTDECRVLGALGSDALPWSPALGRALDASGRDWRADLPALFSADGLGFDPWEVFGLERVARARCGWADAVSRQFGDAFFRQINDWCAAHGLIHVGHVGGEDNLPDHVGGGFWHWFRTAGALHAPGVDIIWRQAFAGQPGFGFPVLAASALHMRPQGAAPATGPLDKLAPSESYSVYGYGAPFDHYRWAAAFQLARGVNRIWPVGYHYETADGRAYGTMSHLGPGNPMWRLWPDFSLWLARLSAAVGLSGHACDVAVYYPIEAEWAFHGRPEAACAWSSWRNVCEALEGEQVPLDILDADAIAAATVAEGRLETPGQSYGAVIVPDCFILPSAVMERLADLHEAGGRVVFLGETVPAIAADEGGQAALDAALARLVPDLYTLDGQKEAEVWPTPAGPAVEGNAISVLDGITAAYLLPGRRRYLFSPQALRRGAILLAPGDELWRMGCLMVYAVGRYVLAPRDPAPNLRLASRWLDEATWVHLVFSEGLEELRLTLELTSEEPLAVEQWDPMTGDAQVVALHRDATEATPIPLKLPPGAVTVLLTRPAEEADALTVGKPAPWSALKTWDAPDTAVVVERCLIEDGAMVVRDGLAERAPASLDRWADLGLGDLCGTVRYTFVLDLSAEHAAKPLLLDLGEVEYAAAVEVNGSPAGVALWLPYVVPVTGLLQPGRNEIAVEVTSTLARQVLREDNVAQARERAWDNPYWHRTLAWHEETAGGGLIGPVRLLAPR